MGSIVHHFNQLGWTVHRQDWHNRHRQTVVNSPQLKKEGMTHEVLQDLCLIELKQCPQSPSKGIYPGAVVYLWGGLSSRWDFAHNAICPFTRILFSDHTNFNYVATIHSDHGLDNTVYGKNMASNIKSGSWENWENRKTFSSAGLRRKQMLDGLKMHISHRHCGGQPHT